MSTQLLPRCIFSRIVACVSILAVFTFSLSACRNDELNADGEGDCPTVSTTSTTLHDAARFNTFVNHTSTGVDVTLNDTATQSDFFHCPWIENSSATANGAAMQTDSQGDVIVDPTGNAGSSGACEDHCCPTPTECTSPEFELSFSSALPSFSGELNFVVEDTSGSHEIVIDADSNPPQVTKCDFGSCAITSNG